MRSVFLVILTQLVISAAAQNNPAKTYWITGVVVDDESGKPISGVEISTSEKPNKILLSDANGVFTVATQADSIYFDHVSYTRIGIVTRDFRSGNTVQMTYGFGNLLDQTVVGGDRTERAIKNQIVSVEHVQPALVQDKNPITIDEIVNQVSGVVVNDGQVNIRNGAGWSYGAGTRALLVLDGMPMISGDAGKVQWNFINPDNISRMEVVKGASSVLYGSSALNGMINLTTSWPDEKPTTRFTSFSGLYSDASRESLKWSDERLTTNGLRFSDSRRVGKSDVVTSFEVVDDKGYRFGDFDSRIRSGVDFRRNVNDSFNYGVKTHLLSTNNGSFLLWNSYDSAYRALDDAKTVTNGLKWRFDPFVHWKRGKWRQSLRARYLYIDNQVDNGDSLNNQSNTNTMIYADYQALRRLNKSIQITAGATTMLVRSNSPLYEGLQKADNLAAYFQWEHKLGPVRYTVGSRFENYRLNNYVESKPVFRAGMQYSMGGGRYLRASYGQGYRFPTIAESYIKTSVGLISIYPNAELQSETGDNIEIGIKQGFKTKKLRGFLDLAAFRMTYQDMMEFAFGQWSSDVSPDNGFGLGFKSLNTGKTEITGIDINTTGELKLVSGTLRFFGGYTASNPVISDRNFVYGMDSTGADLSYVSTSSDTSSDVLKYRNERTFKMDVAYNRGKWNLGVSSRYASRITNIDRAFVDPLFQFFVPGIQTGLDLNPQGFWIFDVRVSYQVNSQFRLSLIQNNLSNQEYMVRPADIGAPRLTMIQAKLTLK